MEPRTSIPRDGGFHELGAGRRRSVGRSLRPPGSRLFAWPSRSGFLRHRRWCPPRRPSRPRPHSWRSAVRGSHSRRVLGLCAAVLGAWARLTLRSPVIPTAQDLSPRSYGPVYRTDIVMVSGAFAVVSTPSLRFLPGAGRGFRRALGGCGTSGRSRSRCSLRRQNPRRRGRFGGIRTGGCRTVPGLSRLRN